VVVDTDNRDGVDGSGNLAELAANLGEMPETLTAITGSGEHLYFRHHPGVPVKNSTGKLADGADIRHLAEVPGWLLDKLTEAKENAAVSRKLDQEAPSVALALNHSLTIDEGGRNNKLYKVGCALRGEQGWERIQILASLLEMNERSCKPPLPEAEVVTITDSVCRHPAEVRSNKSGKRLEQNPLYWFKFNIRQFFSDQNVELMTDVQLGWWIRLTARAWNDGGFLPADYDKLWRLTRARSRAAFMDGCHLVLADFVLVEVEGQFRLKDTKMAADHVPALEGWMKKKEAGDQRNAQRLLAIEADAGNEAIRDGSPHKIRGADGSS
jgi:hypothetical protein